MTPFSVMILIGFFIMIGGFFSGSETALISLNRIKLRHLAESGNRSALTIQKLLEDPDQLMITLLIGTNCSLLVASGVFLDFLEKRGTPGAVVITTAVITPLFLIFGEIIPKALFRYRSFFWLEAFSGLLKLSVKALFPLARVLRFLNDLLLRLMGQKEVGKTPLFVTKEELKYLVQEGEQKGFLKPRERSMIYQIFELSENSVKKVMTPLSQVTAFPASATLAEMMEGLRKSRLSSVLVYDKDPHQFVGLVNLFDVAHEENVGKSLGQFLRPIVSVQERMAIDEVLVTLQTKKSSMAIVENQEKKAIGLVTIEDLLNGLVGAL